MATHSADTRSHLTPPVGARDHALGSKTAPVTLVEYGDYQCPYCLQAYPILNELMEEMGDRLRLVFRNFPITTAHPNAQHAAEAAEAAGTQGKFWEMHDWLYEHQPRLEDEDLLQYAAEIGLEPARFTREFEEHAFATRVREDFMSGVKSGVNGTPTFINGIRHEGPWDLATLSAAILRAAGVR
jgi:protein-disulfide isomerase